LAWLRDAERPRAEEQPGALVPAPAAVPRRPLVLLPEHRRPRGGARVRPGPAAPRATTGAARPPAAAAAVRNRVPAATARPAMARGVVLGRQVPTVRAGHPGLRRRTGRREAPPAPAAARGANDHRVLPHPTVRGGVRGRPPPMESAGPPGRRRPKGPGRPLPMDRAGPPARLRPTAFAAPPGHLPGRERARPRAGRSARAAREPGARSDDQALVPDAGPGTKTGVQTRRPRVRHADGAPTAPPNAPGPADPAPPGPTQTVPAPPRPARTGPAPRDPVRITRRGEVPGFPRPKAAARRTGLGTTSLGKAAPGKPGPGRASGARARRGRAGPACPSLIRSPLSNSTPTRVPS